MSQEFLEYLRREHAIDTHHRMLFNPFLAVPAEDVQRALKETEAEKWLWVVNKEQARVVCPTDGTERHPCATQIAMKCLVWCDENEEVVVPEDVFAQIVSEVTTAENKKMRYANDALISLAMAIYGGDGAEPVKELREFLWARPDLGVPIARVFLGAFQKAMPGLRKPGAHLYGVSIEVENATKSPNERLLEVLMEFLPPDCRGCLEENCERRRESYQA